MKNHLSYNQTKRIAYFITPHGFGHAARAAAVMLAAHELDPKIEFDIFTMVPPWFFEESFLRKTDHAEEKSNRHPNYAYHACQTDIGLVQRSPFEEDLQLTISRLNTLLPFDDTLIAGLVQSLKNNDNTLVLCDIAPLGITAAKAAGIPSVLIENFTWDWIYADYKIQWPEFEKHILYLQEVFNAADYHIQTNPFCQDQFIADLTTHPVSRKPRTAPEIIREKLGISANGKMVLVTLGGVQEQLTSLGSLEPAEDTIIVVPGGSQTFQRLGKVILLPHHSPFYHPDLIHASDLVIGKAGYSTIAEIYHAGVPFGYITRPGFRESGILTAFMQEQMTGMEISREAFTNGKWIEFIPELLNNQRVRHPYPNGSEQIARWVIDMLAR